MKMTGKFDHWVERGSFTSADLGIYRIIYAVAALFTVPDISWVSQYPDFMFQAPPGPLWMLSGFPSPTVLIALEVLRSLTLVMLALGIWTRYVSIAAWAMLSLTYGLTFTLGKIDHTILLVVVPLVLAFANWGDRFSIDALRQKREPLPQRQWPLRLLALLIAWAFFAAALTKLLTGWLSPDSQAARGYFVLGFLTENRTYLLAEWVAAHDVTVAWELVDWMTVVFEFSMLLALPWWRAFRITLAVATTFHLGVLLSMNIDFSNAVVAYGAFVSWGAAARWLGGSRIGRPTTQFVRARRNVFTGPGIIVVLWVATAVVGGAAWFLMVNPVGRIDTGLIAGNAIIVIGAVIGVSYLASQAWTALHRSAPVHPDVGESLRVDGTTDGGFRPKPTLTG